MIQVSEESAVRFTDILRNRKDRIKQLERETVEFNAEVRRLTKCNKFLKSDLQLENCRLTAAFGREDNLKQLHKELQEGCEKIQEENKGLAGRLKMAFMREDDFSQKYRKAQEENKKLQEYADKLADGLPDGMLPKDMELLEKENKWLWEGVTDAEEELEVVRGIELRTRNERDRLQKENIQLINNLDAARGFSGITSAKELREENTQLRGKDKELKDAGVRFRQIMDSQANVIAKGWKDIKKLKVSEEAYRIEAWGLDRDMKRLQKKGCILLLALADARSALKRFLPSAVAERMIKQIDRVLK